MAVFRSVAPTSNEVAASVGGDDVVSSPDVVMDRAFTVDATPETVWPWLIQLGKGRAGWYLPRSAERFLPRRAARRILPQWQGLATGDVIPDYGGATATFEVLALDEPRSLIFGSQRGRVALSWSIALTRTGDPASPQTRIHLRLRLAPVKHQWLARTAGGFFDALTIAGMAAGLRERLQDESDRP